MKLHLALIFLPLFVAGQGNLVIADATSIKLASNSFVQRDNTGMIVSHSDIDVLNGEVESNDQRLAENYFGKALAFALNGEYRQSIYYHRKALKAHSRFYHEDSLEITINLGLTFQLAGREKKARRILRELYVPFGETRNAS